MLVEAAHRLNLQTIVLDAPKSPAKQINALHAHIDGSFSDPEAILKLAEECDVLTVEIEHVDTKVLEELEASSKVEVNHLAPTLRRNDKKTIGHHHSFGLIRHLGSTLMENNPHHSGQICAEISSSFQQCSYC